MTKYDKWHKILLREFHYLFDGAKATDFKGKAKPYVLESRKLLAKNCYHNGKETFYQFLIDSQMLQLSDQWLKFIGKHFDDFMKDNYDNG